MTRRWERFAAGLTVLALALTAGCGLFKPRDPRPGGGPTVNCATPNTSDDVILNTINHYAEQAGIACFIDMLDDSFAFHPDITDSSEIPPGSTVFLQWNKDVESRDARAIAGQTTFRSLAFDSEYALPVISPDQRTETRFFTYRLILHAPQFPDTLYQGRADITFFNGANAQWHITSWVDKRDASGERTWGYLRRINRVGF